MDNQNLEGSLEELGIPAETVLPEGILTPAAIKTVTFTQTRPRGYHFTEVEEFVNGVDHTLTVYADLLHQRDLDIHTLGRLADRLKVDNANLEFQNNSLAIKAEQKLVNDTDSEVQTLMEANLALQARITEMENATEAVVVHNDYDREELEAQVASLLAANAALQEQLNTVEHTVEAATGEYTSEEVADLIVSNQQLINRVTELEAREAATEQWEKDAQAYVADLEAQLEAAKAANVAPAAVAPVNELPVVEIYTETPVAVETVQPQVEAVVEALNEIPLVEETIVAPAPAPQQNTGIDRNLFPDIRPEDL